MGSAVAPAYTIEDAPAQSKYTIEDAPSTKKYLPGRQFGMEVAKGMGLDAEKIKAAEDVGGQEAGLKEIGSQVFEGLTNFAGSVLKDPFNVTQPLHGMASSVEKAIKEKSPGQLMGALSNILGGAEGASKTAEMAGKARESVGKSIHTPEGNLTPGAQLAGETVGTVAGGTIGHEILPGYGALAGAGAGFKLGPSLLDKIFPEPKTLAEAREQAAVYQAKAQDLMRRGKEQDILDRKAAAVQRFTTKQAAQAAKKTPAPSPFGNATPTNISIGTAKLSDLAGQPTPFAQPNVEMVNKFEPPAKTKIVSPDTPPLRVEGSYWSFAKPELLKAVMRGDADAITVWRQRFGTLPPNVKYLTGSEGTSGLYRSNK